YALLCNTTAKIGKETFAKLVERARTKENFSNLLAERSDLPPEFASLMCSWVSVELKAVLTRRFPQSASSIARAVEETALAVEPGTTSPQTSAAKLAAKLYTAGQLRCSFLIRVLNQGQLELFDHGFAKLLGLDVEVMRRVLYNDRPTMMALACRAA